MCRKSPYAAHPRRVGGHLEADETFAEALAREVYEETGWRVSHVLADLGEIRYVGNDGKERVERQYLIRVDGDLPNAAGHRPVASRS